jgi:predicted alpha/beta hydrolase family esterase
MDKAVTKPTIFIIHGTKGSPEGNWFPWLKSELEKLGCEVLVPTFPTPENQSLDTWLKVFDRYKSHIDKDTILVGHSIASAFILSAIQRQNTPVRAAFLVAGFISKLGIPDYDLLNNSFVTAELDWQKIRRNCRRFYCISSDNDPYVPISEGRNIVKKLGVELILLKNAGHMNSESGYTEFKFLLKLIRQEI